MANFTDSISSFNPYIPTLPVETYAKVGLAKQQMYEQGLQRVEGIYNTIADLPVDSKFAPYIEDKLGSLKKQVSNNISGDFSNSQVINSITQAAGTITNDPIVKNALTSTQAIQSKLAYINDIKTKHPELYNPTNEQDALYSIGQWRKDSNLSTPYIDSTPYQPYYDYSKEYSQLQKDYLALPTEYMEKPTEDANGTITTQKFTGKSNSDFQRYIDAHASANFKNQLAVEGRVNATNMDGAVWFQNTYAPYIQSKINSLQSDIDQNNISAGAKSLPSEVEKLKAKTLQDKTQIAALQRSLTDPQERQRAIARMRDINGDINTKTSIHNMAFSVPFSKKPEISYSIDQARVAALKLASKNIRGGIAGSSSSLAFSPNTYGVMQNQAGEMQTDPRITKDKVSGIQGYKDYLNIMHSTEASEVAAMQGTFKDYATSAGYTDSQLTNPLTRQEATDKWMGYMAQAYKKWQTDHSDNSVPDNLKTMFSNSDPKLLTAIGMQRKLENIKANALTQAKQQGLTGMVVNGIHISPEDIMQYKLDGHNDNIAASGILQSKLTPVMGGVGVPFGHQGFVNTTQPPKELTERLSKIPDISPQLQDVVAQVDFTTSVTNQEEGSYKGQPTANTQLIDNLANILNAQVLGGASVGEATDVAGNKLELKNAITNKQLQGAYIDHTTGDAQVTVNLGTEAKPDLHTFKVNSPSLKIDKSADQVYNTLMYLYDGVVPVNIQGGKAGKALPVQITSNGTPESHYTRTSTGAPATYTALTTTGHKIPTPGFAEPSQALEWLNINSSQNQKSYLTLQGQNFIRNYGPGWSQLTQEQKAALLEPVYEKAKAEITEDTIFGSLDNKITDDLPIDLLGS